MHLIINKQLIFVFVALEGNGGEPVMDINDGAGLPSYIYELRRTKEYSGSK